MLLSFWGSCHHLSWTSTQNMITRSQDRFMFAVKLFSTIFAFLHQCVRLSCVGHWGNESRKSRISLLKELMVPRLVHRIIWYSTEAMLEHAQVTMGTRVRFQPDQQFTDLREEASPKLILQTCFTLSPGEVVYSKVPDAPGYEQQFSTLQHKICQSNGNRI